MELYGSGATRHMSPFREQIVTYQKIDARPITAANNKIFHAGDPQIEVPNGATSNKQRVTEGHTPRAVLVPRSGFD